MFEALVPCRRCRVERIKKNISERAWNLPLQTLECLERREMPCVQRGLELSWTTCRTTLGSKKKKKTVALPKEELGKKTEIDEKGGGLQPNRRNT